MINGRIRREKVTIKCPQIYIPVFCSSLGDTTIRELSMKQTDQMINLSTIIVFIQFIVETKQSMFLFIYPLNGI